MSDQPIEAEAEEIEPDDRPDPEEHHADDETVSDTTGTAYSPTGEADATPQDELLEDVEE